MRRILENKQMTSLGLLIAIPATIVGMETFTTVESHAETTSTAIEWIQQNGNISPYKATVSETDVKQKYMVKVIGTFESTTLDVHVPILNSFVYNPNTQEMYAQKFSIESFTNAPVNMNLQEIQVSEDSPWKPTLNAPNTYTDNQWTNLTQEESKEQVALG